MNKKYSKKYFEFYAKKVLEYCYDSSWNSFEHRDRPDLQSEILNIGVEVTRSLERTEGKLDSVFHRRDLDYEKKEEIIKKLGGITYKNPTVMITQGNSKNDIISSIKNKTKKLNEHYQIFNKNILYIFTGNACFNTSDIEESVSKSICETEKYIRKFNSYFIDCMDKLFVVELGGNKINKIEEIIISGDTLRKIKLEAVANSRLIEEDYSMNQIRTRFAPSPTGYMHVGNLRTGLYAWLLARKAGGRFILRIEDTDQARYVEGAVDVIYQTLRGAGLNWDEGPDIGGDFGPYVQSERMAMYQDYAKELVARGGAYHCFCTKEELETRCAAADAEGVARYDGYCAGLEAAEIARRLAAGEPYVIRQRMPREGVTAFDDLVYGHIEVDNAELEDQILIKSDGRPTYNFANVVDDHAMGITHIVRGNEYLSSTPKYNLLYQAFGWEVPQYIHCAPVMKDDQKLSKRNGDASYQDLIAQGYLPQAVVNYLALLGWAPGGEREIFSLSELSEAFDVAGISKAPAIFDPEKLKYINAEYIRALPPEEYKKYALPYIRQAVRREINVDVLCGALQPRTEFFADIPPRLGFIDELPAFDAALYENKKMKTNAATAKEALAMLLPVLERQADYAPEALHGAIFQLIEQAGVKNGYLLWPLRVALCGVEVSPGGGIELAAVLGREETLARVKRAVEKL